MQFRTDLASEVRELNHDEAGIEFEEKELCGIKGTCVKIKTELAQAKTGKKIGTYISFESDAVLKRDVEAYINISKALAIEIEQILNNLEKKKTVLVVGLGNEKMTPDSIGPKVIEKIFVTRHIFEFLPEELDERMHSVCAVAPGVLGVTGVESADIILGICKKVNVGAIIVVDALAARRSERMFSTFQLTDAGIEPGAGVGNKRLGINSETVGVPVIAIGVPTVIYASSLIYDAAVDMLKNSTGKSEELVEDAAQRFSVLAAGDMVVTPKEIDVIASDSAKIIADGINLALHDKMSLEEIGAYMF